jgi:lipopolysaccharide export system protein LptA
MRLSIPRLRVVLIVGATLLVVVLAAFIGYGRYRSLMVYRRLLKRSGISLTHDTNGFTYSQSILNRKIFTLHAARATQLGSGKWALHDAELTLFDRAGNPADHIKGAEIDYDETTEVARAAGVVEMDVQPPQGLANSGRAVASGDVEGALTAAQTAPKTAMPIHVRTSGLVYQRKLGVATTDQRVEFEYGGMQCASMGAEFHSQENMLRLVSQVQMDGIAHGKPLHVTAASAEMDRDNNAATLQRPVIRSDGQTATSDDAVLDLRKDGSIERVRAGEHVQLRSATQQITAARLDATLNAQMLPEKAKLSGGVLLTSSDEKRPMHGSAAMVDALFNAQGAPTVVTATGDARLAMTDQRTMARGLRRSMEGAKIVATFVPGQRKAQSRLSEVHALGSAHAAGESMAAANKGEEAGVKSTQVWADDLRLLLAAGVDGKAQPSRMFAEGHTKLQQDAPRGAQEISSGATLEATFASAPKVGKVGAKDELTLESAVQSGKVTIHTRAASKVGSEEPGEVSTGSADRASYDGAAQLLTLSGNVHRDSAEASLIAQTVVIDEATQDANARGDVRATIEHPNKKTGESAAANPEPVTHLMAASAHFVQARKLAEFYGTDAQPARMWQEASQVQAATLLFDGVKRTLSARTAANGAQIHAVFAGTAAKPKPEAKPTTASIVRVSSLKMDYSELLREATFTGGVTIEGVAGEARGQSAVLFLSPAKSAATQGVATQANPLGGSVERMILSGKVQLEQPGRHGTGEQLLYTAATGSYVLTGTAAVPPRIVDAVQGTVTGATLVVSDVGNAAGSTIVVAGDAAVGKTQGGRVRSEINVKPKANERQ